MTIKPLSGDHRTLVVDDHGISNRYTVAALRQCAGSVRQARTAREALDTALSWYPDLICMDIRLPDGSGLEVIRLIRMTWPTERLQPRVIILTGDDSGLKQSELVALKVECLLVKPVSGRRLREATGLRQSNYVSEPKPGGTGLEIQHLLQQELELYLPELDQCISRLDRNRAAGILHQLIASSAMCKERRLEADMRALDASCRRYDSTPALAQAYYLFLESVREFLCRGTSADS
jgi:CheY-like chemotaxis protein